jgi:hypothetical protein
MLTRLDNIVMVDYWALFECEVAIIAACIPAIRALFTRTSFFQTTKSSKINTTPPHSYPSQAGSSDIKVVTSVEWSEDHNLEKYPHPPNLFSNV